MSRSTSPGYFPFWEHRFSLKEGAHAGYCQKTLRDFWVKHPDCEQQLKACFKEAEDAEGKIPKDIKKDYPGASILEDNRVAFNVKGNRYRLVVKINYAYRMIWIRFVGSHAEYDKIDASKI